jgi:hypothetical protein
MLGKKWRSPNGKWQSGPDLSDSEQRPVSVFGEHTNEYSSSIRGGTFLDHLSDYKLFKNDCFIKLINPAHRNIIGLTTFCEIHKLQVPGCIIFSITYIGYLSLTAVSPFTW